MRTSCTIFVRFNVAYGAPAPREGVQPKERGVHFRDGGTSACSHGGGTVAVPLACARVPRGVRPDQGSRPRKEGRASVLRGRLQSVDPTIERSSTRARPKSRFRLRPAPPGARRGEPAAALLPVERGRATRKKLRQRSQRTPSPRRVATSVGHHCPACASLEKGVQIPWVHAPARGEGVR